MPQFDGSRPDAIFEDASWREKKVDLGVWGVMLGPQSEIKLFDLK